jgi:hypothetical protein
MVVALAEPAGPGASQRRRKPAQVCEQPGQPVALVAAEQLVAAGARQHHDDVLARLASHQVRRDRGRIRARLVQQGEYPGYFAFEVEAYGGLVMTGAQVLSDPAGIRALVMMPAVLEPDREGACLTPDLFGQEGHQQARIHAARKQHADRTVREQHRARRFREPPGDLVGQLIERNPGE